MKNLLLTFFIFCLYQASVYSQVTIHSTDGYDVTIAVRPVSVEVLSSDCTFGYSFKVNMEYDIVFSGPNQPQNLWNFQGNLKCDDNISMNFQLPPKGGTGYKKTDQSYWNGSNCDVATPEMLGCNTNELIVSGPGILQQTNTYTVDELWGG